MIQFKPGDLARWSFHPRPRRRPRLRPRLRRLLRLIPRLRLRLRLRLENSFGLILQDLEPKDVFNQRELIKHFDSIRDQPFLWFSFKEMDSFLVFQDELSLAEKLI